MPAVFVGEDWQAAREAEERRLANERAAFERWITAMPYERSTARMGPDTSWPGQYQEYSVQLAWEAWLERATR